MSKKSEFIDYINGLNLEMPQSVKDYWDVFCTSASNSDKPEITEKGIEVLKNIRACGLSIFKAKDIADYMGVTSRSVSGTMTKLKSDGFLERLSDDGIAVYSLTDKGNTYNI